MKKLHRTLLKTFSASILGLASLAIAGYCWVSRTPSTELIDATGEKLTAGMAGDNGDGLSDASPFAIARTLIQERQFEAAKAKLLKALEESDRDGEACILLCDVSRELREIDAAVDYGLKAVTLLPESAAAHLAYAEALGAKIFSDMQSMGGMLSAMGQVGRFKEELNRVVQLNPDDTKARAMLVFSNMAPRPIGNIDRAIELSQEIETRDPVLGKQLLAACYQRNEETERAISLLKAAIIENPGETRFHFSLAEIFANQQQLDDAELEYELARQGAKDETYYRSLYGQARMWIQNEVELDRSLALLDEFIVAEPIGDSMPTASHALWRKGNALEQLGRIQMAKAAYEESIRRDPSFSLAKKALEALEE